MIHETVRTWEEIGQNTDEFCSQKILMDDINSWTLECLCSQLLCLFFLMFLTKTRLWITPVNMLWISLYTYRNVSLLWYTRLAKELLQFLYNNSNKIGKAGESLINIHIKNFFSEFQVDFKAKTGSQIISKLKS